MGLGWVPQRMRKKNNKRCEYFLLFMRQGGKVDSMSPVRDGINFLLFMINDFRNFLL